jgi:DUF177 domain-containing protein
MAGLTHDFDLGGMRLTAGEGRGLELEVALEPLSVAGEEYRPDPERVPARLDVSRMVGNGYALRLRLSVALAGPCMRCLGDARPVLEIDAREVEVPGGGEELASPYVDGELLHLDRWAQDAFALAIPVQVLCASDCAGLCPVCAVDLREAGPEHHHERPPDPRWAKLRELRL